MVRILFRKTVVGMSGFYDLPVRKNAQTVCCTKLFALSFGVCMSTFHDIAPSNFGLKIPEVSLPAANIAQGLSSVLLRR